jgi:uncharacterized protein (DUF342 family)
MSKTAEFYKRQRELHTEVITALQKAIGKKKVNLEDLEQEFEDESFNTVVKVDRNTVYTDGSLGEYPINDLTVNDALYIMGVLEK